MKKILLIITFIGIVSAGYFTVNAQWAPPSGPAPTRNVLAPLHTGDGIQTKNSGLIIQKTNNLQNFIDMARLGFATDSSIGVELPKYATSNPLWEPLKDNALDTNAPIAINGAYINTDLESKKSFTTETVFVRGLEKPEPSQVNSFVCAYGGFLKSCDKVKEAKLKPTVRISVNSGSIIMRNTPTQITVSWNSEGADRCVALQGDGFSTGYLTSGSNAPNLISLDTGEFAEYSVICYATNGAFEIASIFVTPSTFSDLTNVSLDIDGAKSLSLDAVEPEALSEFTINVKITGKPRGSCTRSTQTYGAFGPYAWSPFWVGNIIYAQDQEISYPNIKVTPLRYSPDATHEGWRKFNLTCYTSKYEAVSDSVIVYLGY